MSVSLQSHGRHRDPHSFPTRRSSDLNRRPSHGPQAKTNASATRVAPSDSLTPRSSPSARRAPGSAASRSEEHTSELQSLTNLVCRLLLEKKKNEQTSSVHRREQP